MDPEVILQGLREQGYKVTPQRRRLVELLCDTDHDQTADELFSRLQEAYPEIGLDTVYRNLHLLTRLGAVSQVKLVGQTTVFALNRHRHHHALVCTDCGVEIEFEQCPIKELTALAEQEFGFQIMNHRLELYGICADCRSAS